MLIVRPLKYSLRFQYKVKKQISTLTIDKGQNIKETDCDNKIQPVFLFIGLMGCKTGKIQPSQDVKCQINRNIKKAVLFR